MKKTILLSLFAILVAYTSFSQIYQKHLSVTQCDSLIQANALNPNFVILDVRTAGEHNPSHLEGAINRDYFASNFSALLDSLPQHKLYLIHCQSGGRSGNVFNSMVSKGFTKVANMLGGFNSWNSASLPSTSNFAPLLMSVSDTVDYLQVIDVGLTDTINLTVTNRANSILTFDSISLLSGEFVINFDTSITLEGAEDYSFSIYYTPSDEELDTAIFYIKSNAGEITYKIYRIGDNGGGNNNLGINDYLNSIKVYPNPSEGYLRILNFSKKISFVKIYNQKGQLINEKQFVEKIDFFNLEKGLYNIVIQIEGQIITKKVVVE